jgi:ketosteroid isomerase-like protein
MSEENVEVVQRIYSDWERGNFETVKEVLDPDVVFETFMPDSPESVIVEGRERIREFMLEWFGQWQNYRVIGDEFRRIDESRVFAGGRQAAAGHTSGVEVESPGFTIWTFRSGKVVRLVAHYDRSAALEAAGLQE